MFGRIVGLPQNAYQAMPDDIDGMKEEFGRRKELLSNYIRDLGQRAGMDQERHRLNQLEIKNTYTIGLTEGHIISESKPVMELPLQYYIDFDRDFHVHDLVELRAKLEDDEWALTYFNRLADIAGGIHFEESEVPQMKKNFLPCLEFFLENPEKADNAARFVLLHELSHYHNGDTEINYSEIILVILGMFPFIYLALELGFLLSPTVVSLGISFIVAGVIYLLAYVLILTHIIVRNKEIAADHLAATALNGIEGEKIREGGIYFFEFLLKYESSSLITKLMDPHPSTQDRIDALRNHIPNQLGSLQPALV